MSTTNLEDSEGYPSANYLRRSNQSHIQAKYSMMRGFNRSSVLSTAFRAVAFVTLRVVRSILKKVLFIDLNVVVKQGSFGRMEHHTSSVVYCISRNPEI